MAKPKKSSQAKREYRKPAVTKQTKLVDVAAGNSVIVSGVKA